MKRFWFIPLALISMFSCDIGPEEMNSDSDDFETISERVEYLKLQLNEASDFSNAEFELFNVNGLIPHDKDVRTPGASSMDFKFVIKIDPTDFNKWLFQRTRIPDPSWNLAWMDDIISKRKNYWKVSGTPEYYGNENSQLIYYPKEGIMFRRERNL